MRSADRVRKMCCATFGVAYCVATSIILYNDGCNHPGGGVMANIGSFFMGMMVILYAEMRFVEDNDLEAQTGERDRGRYQAFATAPPGP